MLYEIDWIRAQEDSWMWRAYCFLKWASVMKSVICKDYKGLSLALMSNLFANVWSTCGVASVLLWRLTLNTQRLSENKGTLVMRPVWRAKMTAVWSMPYLTATVSYGFAPHKPHFHLSSRPRSDFHLAPQPWSNLPPERGYENKLLCKAMKQFTVCYYAGTQRTSFLDTES